MRRQYQHLDQMDPLIRYALTCHLLHSYDPSTGSIWWNDFGEEMGYGTEGKSAVTLSSDRRKAYIAMAWLWVPAIEVANCIATFSTERCYPRNGVWFDLRLSNITTVKPSLADQVRQAVSGVRQAVIDSAINSRGFPAVQKLGWDILKGKYDNPAADAQ